MTPAASQIPAAMGTARAAGTWLGVTEHLDAKYGGVCSVVPELCMAVNRTGDYRMSLGGFCAADESLPQIPELDIMRFPSGWKNWANVFLLSQLRESIRLADGVHIHGIWREHCALASWFARKLDRPYILSAHGMLDGWAVRSKRLKKGLYAALIERRNCAGATCLHALTRAEAGDYRRFGLRGPIAIVPNGISVPSDISPRPFFDAYPHLKDRRIILFLGRVHPKKGVDLLCRALPAIRRANSDAHLVVAGPDCDGFQSQVEAMIAEAKMESHVTFTGMMRGDLKWSAFAACEAFILPSHSEGLSVAVLEAMGAGCPVIVTRQCNMPEVSERQCGMEIEPVEEEIAEAVTTFLDLPWERRHAMGINGEALVRERYLWPAIGAQMASLYRWASGAARPSNVEILEV